MNSFIKRWIDDLILEIDGEFSAITIRDKIYERKGMKYLESTTSIGAYLSKHKDLLKIEDYSSRRTYRRKEQ